MKKLLAILLLVALALSAGACSKSKQTPAPSASPTASAPPEKIQVSIGLPGLAQPVAGKTSGQMSDHIAQEFGIEFIPWIMSEADSREKLASAAASGGLPDLFAMEAFGNPGLFRQLIDQKLIRDIPEEIYKKFMRLGAVMYRYQGAVSVDGKMWFVPRSDMVSRYDNGQSTAIWYRLDWALESGLITAGQAPSWEDFFKLMAYFAKSDLDGNDCDDTWPLTAYGEGLGGLKTAFFMTFGVRDWVLEGGKWIPGVLSSRAREATKWAAQAYRDGYIDGGFSGQTEEAAMEKFCLGKAGMLVADASPAGAARLNAVLQIKQPALDIRKAFSVLPQSVNPWGVAYNEDDSYHTGILFSAAVDDGKLKRLLGFMDWMLTDGGLTYTGWGLEGTDYNVTGDGLQTLHRDDNGLPITFAQLNPEWSAMSTLATWGYDFMPAVGEDDYRWKYLDTLKNSWWANNWRRPMFTKTILDPAVQGFDAEGKADAALAELIMHSVNIDGDWDAYVQKMTQELNVDAVAAIVNDYAQKNNITTEE